MMLAIYGPTVTGKTDLAIRLAKKFNGELISADSRQVYKGLDIGSGKISLESRVEKHVKYWIIDGVKINGFDIIDPGKQFTVADFIKLANRLIVRIRKQNKIPIVVGGTGFYIQSLLDGIDTIGIDVDTKLRKRLEDITAEKLYPKLFKLNPNRALTMNQSDRSNPRRLIRAIEIALSMKKEKKVVSWELDAEHYMLIGLTGPNEYLYEKADNWLEERFNKGLVKEVKNLFKNNVDPTWLKNLGLEYKWITKYLLNETTFSVTKIRLKGDIHSFIRRQKTYLKQFKKINLFDITDKNYKDEIEKTIRTWYNQKNG